MAGFLRWLAPRYGEIQDNLRHEIAELRDTTADGGHRRTPEIVASLAIGLRYFLAYAVDAGAIDTAERERRWIAGWRVLLEVAQAQAAHLQAADPAQRFVELISAALGAGDAHLASLSGVVPQDNAEAWGWRRETVGVDEHGHAPSGESDVCAYPATVKRDEVVLPKPLAIGVQPPPELHLGLRGDLAGPTHHCRHGGTRGLRVGARRSSAPTDRSPSHSGARVCGVVSSQVVVPKMRSGWTRSSFVAPQGAGQILLRVMLRGVQAAVGLLLRVGYLPPWRSCDAQIATDHLEWPHVSGRIGDPAPCCWPRGSRGRRGPLDSPNREVHKERHHRQ